MNQKGQTNPALMPTPNKGWALEISLDLDMVSAICPNCKIMLVEANNASLNSLGHAVRTAFRHGAKYISNSYGGPEDPSELVADRLYYKHPGVVVTASAGDEGFGVQYPAASRFVTAVGGTHLVRSSNKRGWSERAWGPPDPAQGIGATGSGCSKFEPKPAWQHDPACHRRTVADVSAIADPNPGVFVYDTFQERRVHTRRRHLGVRADHRRDLRAGRPPGTGHLPGVLPVPAPRPAARRDRGPERHVRPDPAVPRGPGLRRPDRLGHPERLGSVRTVAAGLWGLARG